MSAVMNVGWKQKVQGQNVKKIIFCQSAKKMEAATIVGCTGILCRWPDNLNTIIIIINIINIIIITIITIITITLIVPF